MKKLSDYTVIGKIINTRGIKGELKIFPMTSVINRFSKLKNVYVGENLTLYEISSVKYDNRFVYLKFKGYDNINDVIRLKESNIYIKDEDRIPLDENTFFISDLIGCKVYNMEGLYLGELKDVIENPVHDLYVIVNNQKESLIPAISNFVKLVDIENKVIKIDPIEGLINWNLVF